MPKRSPFTALCGQLARLNRPQRADLHIHTIASDGEYTPSQVVALATQAGLMAVAITDHDTTVSVADAQEVAGEQIEIIPGVEISAEYERREIHLLGYFIRLDHRELNEALARVRESRQERFRDFIHQLAQRGHRIPEDRVKLVEENSPSLGRRHVAGLLTACGFARTRTEAFHRFLGPITRQVQPKKLVPAEEAIQLVIAAGGVTALAHPPELTEDDFHSLAGMGLGALEVEFPSCTNKESLRLREIASRMGLALSGGSDCHGPQPSHRGIGSCTITADELNRLRQMCGLRKVAKC
jgi:3',5'-nucleoside bisphosphate phosphatase